MELLVLDVEFVIVGRMPTETQCKNYTYLLKMLKVSAFKLRCKLWSKLYLGWKLQLHERRWWKYFHYEKLTYLPEIA